MQIVNLAADRQAVVDGQNVNGGDKSRLEVILISVKAILKGFILIILENQIRTADFGEHDEKE